MTARLSGQGLEVISWVDVGCCGVLRGQRLYAVAAEPEAAAEGGIAQIEAQKGNIHRGRKDGFQVSVALRLAPLQHP